LPQLTCLVYISFPENASLFLKNLKLFCKLKIQGKNTGTRIPLYPDKKEVWVEAVMG